MRYERTLTTLGSRQKSNAPCRACDTPAVEISPAVGISGERLVAALREAELYVGSARGAGGDVHQRLVTYQRWVNDEARRLGPLLRPGDLGRLITTPACSTTSWGACRDGSAAA